MTEDALPILVSYEITEGTGDLYQATVSLITLQKLLGNELLRVEVVIPDPAIAQDARKNWLLAQELGISIVETATLDVGDIPEEGGFLIQGAPIALVCRELTIGQAFTLTDGARRTVCITANGEESDAPPPSGVFSLRARLGAFSQPERHVFREIDDAAFADLRKTIRRHHRNGYFWDFRYRTNPGLGSGVGSRGIYQTIKREILNRLVVAHDLSVVDIGCGDLEVCRLLSFRSYIGVDEAPQALELARRKRPDWSFQLAPLDTSAGPAADAAICFEVLIHAPTHEAATGLIGTLTSGASQRIVVSGYDNPVPKSSIVYFHEPLRDMLRRATGWKEPVLVARYENLSVYVMDRQDSHLPDPTPFDELDAETFTWDALTKLERSIENMRTQIAGRLSQMEDLQNRTTPGRRKRGAAGRPSARPSIATGAPIVSVIVSFRNERERIENMMRSLACQGEPSFEVHMIDDGSDDGTTEIVSDFAARDSRFVLWENADNRGPSARRNQGIESARGKYLFFVDGDDELTPDAIETLLDISLRNGSEVVRGSNFFHFTDGRSSPNTFDQYHQPEVNGVSYDAMPSLVFLYTTSNMLIDRALLEDTGLRFDEMLRLGEDRLLAQQLFAASRSISLTKKITYRWIRDRNSSSQLSLSESRDARISAIHAYLSLINTLPEATERHREFAQAAMFWEVYLNIIKKGPTTDLDPASRNRLGQIVDLLDFPDGLLLDPCIKGWSAAEQTNARSAYLRLRRAQALG